MVDRFLINLNRGEGQEEKLIRWRKRRESLTIYSILLVFIVLTVFNYNNYKTLKTLVQTKEEKIRLINHQLDELKRQGQNVSKADVMSIARLEKTRFLWTKKFWALAEVLPEGIAVTGMEFTSDAFIVKFISKVKKNEKDFEKVSNIMDLLKGTQEFYSDFKDVKFAESHRIVVDRQDVLSFSIKCNLRKTIKTSGSRKVDRRRM
jgi:Tfp pilus assembly protein PilN